MLHPLGEAAPTPPALAEALHPLGDAAPLRGRCTRWGMLHPIRRGVMHTDRVWCRCERSSPWARAGSRAQSEGPPLKRGPSRPTVLDGRRQQFETRWSYAGWAGVGASFGGSVALWVMGRPGVFLHLGCDTPTTRYRGSQDVEIPPVAPVSSRDGHVRLSDGPCLANLPSRPATALRRPVPPQRPAATPRRNAPPPRGNDLPGHRVTRSVTDPHQHVVSYRPNRSAPISHPTPDMVEDSTY
mgnify:CR=1 FL=1